MQCCTYFRCVHYILFLADTFETILHAASFLLLQVPNRPILCHFIWSPLAHIPPLLSTTHPTLIYQCGSSSHPRSQTCSHFILLLSSPSACSQPSCTYSCSSTFGSSVPLAYSYDLIRVLQWNTGGLCVRSLTSLLSFASC